MLVIIRTRQLVAIFFISKDEAEHPASWILLDVWHMYAMTCRLYPGGCLKWKECDTSKLRTFKKLKVGSCTFYNKKEINDHRHTKGNASPEVLTFLWNPFSHSRVII